MSKICVMLIHQIDDQQKIMVTQLEAFLINYRDIIDNLGEVNVSTDNRLTILWLAVKLDRLDQMERLLEISADQCIRKGGGSSVVELIGDLFKNSPWDKTLAEILDHTSTNRRRGTEGTRIRRPGHSLAADMSIQTIMLDDYAGSLSLQLMTLSRLSNTLPTVSPDSCCSLETVTVLSRRISLIYKSIDDIRAAIRFLNQKSMEMIAMADHDKVISLLRCPGGCLEEQEIFWHQDTSCGTADEMVVTTQGEGWLKEQEIIQYQDKSCGTTDEMLETSQVEGCLMELETVRYQDKSCGTTDEMLEKSQGEGYLTGLETVRYQDKSCGTTDEMLETSQGEGLLKERETVQYQDKSCGTPLKKVENSQFVGNKDVSLQFNPFILHGETLLGDRSGFIVCIDLMMSKTKTINEDKSGILRLKNLYERLFKSTSLTRTLLVFLMFQQKVTIAVDLNSWNIAQMSKRVIDQDEFVGDGRDYCSFSDFFNHKIYLGGKLRCISEEDNLIGSFAMSLAQMSIYLAFGNEGKPYAYGDIVREKQYKDIVMMAEKTKYEVSGYYGLITCALNKKTLLAKEMNLISTVPRLFVTRAPSPEGGRLVRLLPSLVDYYERLVMATLQENSKP